MKSFIAYSETSDFPIENLPYGVFSTAGNVRYVTNIVYRVKCKNAVTCLNDGPRDLNGGAVQNQILSYFCIWRYSVQRLLLTAGVKLCANTSGFCLFFSVDL